MPMNTKSLQSTEVVVSRKEMELLAKGYRKTNKSNAKLLLPGEYIKNNFTGSVTSFEGVGGVTLTWCPMPNCAD